MAEIKALHIVLQACHPRARVVKWATEMSIIVQNKCYNFQRLCSPWGIFRSTGFLLCYKIWFLCCTSVRQQYKLSRVFYYVLLQNVMPLPPNVCIPALLQGCITARSHRPQQKSRRHDQHRQALIVTAVGYFSANVCKARFKNMTWASAFPQVNFIFSSPQ